MNEALQALRKIVPKDGTSLENAFVAMNALNPQPDNVIMITDGLPTQGASAPLIRKTIDGDDRLKLFERAFAKYPRDVPFNVILMPMEGDPIAPSAFWARGARHRWLVPEPVEGLAVRAHACHDNDVNAAKPRSSASRSWTASPAASARSCCCSCSATCARRRSSSRRRTCSSSC